MTAGGTGDPRPWLLAIDTATSQVLVVAGTPTGEVLASRSAPGEHRHGERLLAMIDALVTEARLELSALRGVVVGTGPGAFTGLRVGLATAKTLAHELAIAIAGVSTAEALLASAAGAGIGGENVVLRLPAGPHDRVEVRAGQPPRLLLAEASADAASAGEVASAADAPSAADAAGGGVPRSETAIAVDLEGRAPEADLGRGAAALAGLPAALLRLGVARLDAHADDAATLVPEYVMLPRGVAAGLDVGEGVSWSHDRP